MRHTNLIQQNKNQIFALFSYYSLSVPTIVPLFMPNTYRANIPALEDLEDRLRLASSRLRFDLLLSLRNQSYYFATDRFGSVLHEGSIVEILTTTIASVHEGTIGTVLKCRTGHGPDCWCSIKIWSGPKKGKIFSRKAKNLRKLICDNDDIQEF